MRVDRVIVVVRSVVRSVRVRKILSERESRENSRNSLPENVPFAEVVVNNVVVYFECFFVRHWR